MVCVSQTNWCAKLAQTEILRVCAGVRGQIFIQIAAFVHRLMQFQRPSQTFEVTQSLYVCVLRAQTDRASWVCVHIYLSGCQTVCLSVCRFVYEPEQFTCSNIFGSACELPEMAINTVVQDAEADSKWMEKDLEN